MKLSDTIISAAIASILVLLAGLYGVLKMIFTNETKIKVLESELNNLSLMLAEVRDEQKQLFKEIRNTSRE